MKRIINGKKYDTETAEEMYAFGMGVIISDLPQIYTTLYRKSSGEYFLVHMDTPDQNAAIIQLITEENVKTLIENRANNNYEEIFGEVEE